MVLLQLIDNKKNSRGYHIPMIGLGKFKEVTVVLKLLTTKRGRDREIKCTTKFFYLYRLK